MKESTMFSATVSKDLYTKVMNCGKFLVQTNSLPEDEKNPGHPSKYMLTKFALELLAGSLDEKLKDEIINNGDSDDNIDMEVGESG